MRTRPNGLDRYTMHELIFDFDPDDMLKAFVKEVLEGREGHFGSLRRSKGTLRDGRQGCFKGNV